MKILIAGAGGLGCYFGARLLKAGSHVEFLSRGPHHQAMASSGLKIKSVNGDFQIDQVKSYDNLHSSESIYDIILLSCKTTSLVEICEMLQGKLDAEGSILHIQNGLGSFEVISSFFPKDQIISGLAYIVSMIESPGVILQKSAISKLVFGHYEGLTPKTSYTRFENLCKEAQIDINWENEITNALVHKFIMISAFSGLTAYYNCTLGEILNNESRQMEFRDCLMETARATKDLPKVPLDPDTKVDEIFKFSMGLEPSLTSSLQEDISKGKPSELKSLTGHVIKLAGEKGLDIPINKKIYEKLK